MALEDALVKADIYRKPVIDVLIAEGRMSVLENKEHGGKMRRGSQELDALEL